MNSEEKIRYLEGWIKNRYEFLKNLGELRYREIDKLGKVMQKITRTEEIKAQIVPQTPMSGTPRSYKEVPSVLGYIARRIFGTDRLNGASATLVGDFPTVINPEHQYPTAEEQLRRWNNNEPWVSPRMSDDDALKKLSEFFNSSPRSPAGIVTNDDLGAVVAEECKKIRDKIKDIDLRECIVALNDAVDEALNTNKFTELEIEEAIRNFKNDLSIQDVVLRWDVWKFVFEKRSSASAPLGIVTKDDLGRVVADKYYPYDFKSYVPSRLVY